MIKKGEQCERGINKDIKRIKKGKERQRRKRERK
jgi:hypothetical protein